METIDLLSKFGDKLENQISGWLTKNAKSITDTNETLGLKTGDIITFTNGYGVPMKTKITAFDKETGKPYLYWDCFWFAIGIDKIFLNNII